MILPSKVVDDVLVGRSVQMATVEEIAPQRSELVYVRTHTVAVSGEISLVRFGRRDVCSEGLSTHLAWS